MGLQGGGAAVMISGCLEGKKLSLCQCSLPLAAWLIASYLMPPLMLLMSGISWDFDVAMKVRCVVVG